ncbi:MAG TPA: uracil-DNA glycosylase family protein [Ornithinimicrobium sp.]|nr:uracil-DNA glycosylase family protein [Ornithinimicrobium sp.]
MHDDGHPATHRTMAQWMGEPVLTLDDVWPARPRGVIVGLNPTPTSVAAGHYYQGRLGQRQLLRLADAGLFRRPGPGCTYFEDAALDAGIGLTDVVKRPTCAEKHVSPREIEFGRTALNAALEDRGVPLVICVFRHPVAVLLGSSGRPGFQPSTTTWGARVFRMPGPFAPADEVRDVMMDLSQDIAAAP